MDNLVLSLGARSEKVKYDLNQKDLAFGFAPLDDSESTRESAYSAGLTFLYSEKSSVFARANRSFRFPLTDELVLFDFFSGKIVVNPDLDPQVGNHYEVGVRHYFTPDIQANMTLFHAEIKDEIFFNSVTFANENHPETIHKGVEMGAKAKILKNITILGNYTYTKATFEKEPFKNDDIPAVPRNKVNLGIRIHDLLPGLVFSADYNYVSDSYAISDAANEFEKLDDYYTIDSRVSYQWKMLKVFFGVNNITDKKYSEYAVIGGFPAALNFYPAPERNYLGGLEVVF